MDFVLYVLAGALCVAVGVIAASFTFRKPSAAPVDPPKRRLPVLDPSCSNCAHFDLTAGQQLMGQHPAFMGAAQHLAPWQMMQTAKSTPNPDHAELTAKLAAATKAGDAALMVELRKQLDETPEELAAKLEPGDVSRELRAVQWSDYGYCLYDPQLVDKSHHCDGYQLRDDES